MTDVASENDPVKIVDLPINMVIFHSYLKLPEGRSDRSKENIWLVVEPTPLKKI